MNSAFVKACIEAAAPVAQEPAFPPLEGAGDGGAWPDLLEVEGHASTSSEQNERASGLGV